LDVVVRFSGFELDRVRGELRGPDGETVKLRPKTFGMLALFAAHAGRVLSKQELMEALWPNVHVAEDSLFKCIRELRTALGDDKRQLIRLMSGQGYLFEADVTHEPATHTPVPGTTLPDPAQPDPLGAATGSAAPVRRFGRRTIVALAASAVFLIAGLTLVTTVATGIFAGRGPLTLAVTPITSAESDLAAIAADVTTRLSDGLAKIDNVRVAMPQAAQDSGASRPDFVVSGELGKHDGSWEVRARMTRTTTGEVVWATPVSLAADDSDLVLQKSRLAASIGEPLAQRINALINAEPQPTDDPSSGRAKVAIEQAVASITQTTKERFAASLAILEKALADDPDNAGLAVALASLQMRAVQMVWYTPTESAAAETRARAILEHGLKRKPGDLPMLEAYCRFLNATNEFVESLVACARVLSFDPWSGVGLFNMGLGQLQLGRFDDALATFKRADSFDTPRSSRWTWRLGAGMTYLMMGRSEDALPWLQSSIAITPATGRSHMLLSAAYQETGRPAEAKTAMEKGMALRPGSNLANVLLPPKNASAAFLAAGERLGRAFVAAGLPER
jgi:DNA-binding winged helix-turn-helix (wHTH) protein/tetratricopeptide (TPR) repeat protein